MRVLFFGTYDAEAITRVRVLQEGFAALGDDVEECNVPLALDTAWRVRILQRPWLVPVLGFQLCSAWARLLARARTVGKADAVVVGYMGHFDVQLARLLWRRPARCPRSSRLRRRYGARPPEPVVAPAPPARARRPVRAASDRGSLYRHGGEPRAAPSRVPQKGRRRPRRCARTVVSRAGRPRARGTAARRLLRKLRPLHGATVIGEAIALLAGGDGSVSFTMVGRGQDYERTRAAAGPAAAATWIDCKSTRRPAARGCGP